MKTELYLDLSKVRSSEKYPMSCIPIRKKNIFETYNYALNTSRLTEDELKKWFKYHKKNHKKKDDDAVKKMTLLTFEVWPPGFNKGMIPKSGKIIRVKS